jgi:hypothetical protein
MPQDTTPLDEVSSLVPDSATMTPDDEKSAREATLRKVAPRLREVVARIDAIQQVLRDNLPQYIAEAPLGDAVDMVADIKEVVGLLYGDGSTVVTNNLNMRIKTARENSLPERLERDRLKNFSTDGWRIARTSRVNASILPEHKDDAYEWLRSNDYGDLIKPTVNASSLAAVGKELLESGKELPDDYFRVHVQPNVSFTRVGKRGS